jgi:hypothetical protein
LESVGNHELLPVLVAGAVVRVVGFAQADGAEDDIIP